jgi:hypothetical protein
VKGENQGEDNQGVQRSARECKGVKGQMLFHCVYVLKRYFLRYISNCKNTANPPHGTPYGGKVINKLMFIFVLS